MLDALVRVHLGAFQCFGFLESGRIISSDRSFGTVSIKVGSVVSLTQLDRLLSGHCSAVVHGDTISLVLRLALLIAIVEDMVLEEHDDEVARDEPDDATCHIDDRDGIVVVRAHLRESLNLANALDNLTLLQ